MVDDATVRAAILDAILTRGAGKTICPSEVARALTEDWRPLMPAVRRVAQSLSDEGALAITQKGKPVHIDNARGPIRLGLSSSD